MNHIPKVCRLLLLVVLVFYSETAVGSGQGEPERWVQIYEADGSIAKQCLVVSATPKNRAIVVGSLATDGNARMLDLMGIRRITHYKQIGDFDNAPETKPEVLSNGKLSVQDDTAYFVVSSDGRQVAFVPCNHKGTITLRQCGTLTLDTSKLKAAQNYSVMVTWTNCLAGSYATLASQKPGDPKQPELDWRFRNFIAFVSRFEVKFNKSVKLTLPPGEVAIAVVGDDQKALLSQFGAQSNGKKEYLGKPDSNFFAWPTNNGIHIIRPGKNSSFQLNECTCLAGTIQNGRDGLPDWNDEGFAEATVSFADVRHPYSSFIPNYDIVNQGVDHYYKVLNSDLGRRWRELSASRPFVFVKANGQFLSTPVPAGQYLGQLYQKSPSSWVDVSGGQSRLSSVGKPLFPVAVDDPYRNPTARMLLIEMLRIGAYYGDFAAAGKKSAELESKLKNAELTSAEKKRREEVATLLERRKQLDRLYRSRDVGERLSYNDKAAKFLLDVAAMFLELDVVFQWPDEVLKHTVQFRAKWDDDNEADTPKSLRKLLEQKRRAFLLGELDLAQLYPGSFSVDQDTDAIQNFGEFKYLRRTHFSSTVDFLPLQKMKVESRAIESGFATYDALKALKKVQDNDSEDFRVQFNRLRTQIGEEFDLKVKARELQLARLQSKIKIALDSLSQRKTNREQIIDLRLQDLLQQNGLQPKANK